MVRLTLRLDTRSALMQRRIKGTLCATLLVLTGGSSVGGALHALSASSLVQSTTETTVEAAPPVAGFNPRPVPAPGPPPCVEPFCVMGTVE